MTRLTERAEADLAARRAREAEALRANLRRRKVQQRGGTTPEVDEAGEQAGEQTQAPRP